MEAKVQNLSYTFFFIIMLLQDNLYHVEYRTYLKLPWRPLISVDGSTVYDLDDQLKVSKQAS